MKYISHEPGLTAELETNDTTKILRLELVGSIDRNVEIWVTAGNGAFLGSASFGTTVQDLQRVCSALSEHVDAAPYDQDSESYIKISAPAIRGHILADALVGGSWDSYARILFETDQTSMPGFLTGLSKILEVVK